jgi:hypothetical protein
MKMEIALRTIDPILLKYIVLEAKVLALIVPKKDTDNLCWVLYKKLYGRKKKHLK